MKKRPDTRHFASKLGVFLHLHPHPAASRVRASAEGNHVFLDLRDDFLGSERSLRLLHHELCHVLQQRHGRVVATAHDGYSVNRDPALEMEAELAASLPLSSGDLYAQLRATRGLQPADSVLQCFTSIAGKVITGPQELSQKAQTILDLIPWGVLSLQRLTSNDLNYAFPTEADFLVGVQQGLHGSPALLLPVLKILVSPQALYDMPLHELEQLFAVEKQTQEKEPGPQIRASLSRRNLLSESELDLGDRFLKRFGLMQHPALASRNLDDRISIFELLHHADTAVEVNVKLQREAANFAIRHAQTPMEFVDYYRVFMSQVKDPNPSRKSAEIRGRTAEDLASMLTPVLLRYLQSPRLDSPPRPDELPGILSSWSARGYHLGFSRLSAALADVAQFAGLEIKAGETGVEAVKRYMDQLQAVWLNQRPTSMRYSQSGSRLQYVYQTKHGVLTLQLAPDGNLTIGL